MKAIVGRHPFPQQSIPSSHGRSQSLPGLDGLCTPYSRFFVCPGVSYQLDVSPKEGVQEDFNAEEELLDSSGDLFFVISYE